MRQHTVQLTGNKISILDDNGNVKVDLDDEEKAVQVQEQCKIDELLKQQRE